MFPYSALDEPRLVGPLTIVAAAIVTAFWGSRTLATTRCSKHCKRIAVGLAVLSALGLLGSPRTQGYFIQVQGMFHANLTDVPYWSPLLPLLGVVGPIDKKRAHNIVSAYSLAFFDVHLLGKTSGLLGGDVRNFPEVIFERHLR